MRRADERPDLILDCLCASDDPVDVNRLRLALYSQPQAFEGLFNSAARWQILDPVVEALFRKGIIHRARKDTSLEHGLRSELSRIQDDLAARRQALHSGLVSAIAALNAAGIAPVVLKGSVSLLTMEPWWRFQRDIDLAVRPSEVQAAVKALREIGFEFVEGHAISSTHHHLPAMIRPDVPGPVELHTRLGGRKTRRHLPDNVLQQDMRELRIADVRVRLLRDDHHLLYGLTHHHFENLGSVFGTLSLKGLLEFAHTFQRMDDGMAIHLTETLAHRPRLAGAFELWVAACIVILGLRPDRCVPPAAHAMQEAESIRQRMLETTVASRGAAISAEIQQSLNGLKRGRTGLTGLIKLPGVVLAPLFESYTSRSGKHGEAKHRKVSGLVDV